MIRSLGYFPSQCARNGNAVISAMISSARMAGITVRENDLDCDAALIWSVLWAGRMSKNKEIYQNYRADDRPVIIAEVGTLRRGTTWKIAVNNITSDGHYGHQQDLDPDRPCKLQIGLQSNSTNPSILIAAQHSESHQVRDQPDTTEWIRQQINAVQRYTDRPIIVRPHPRDRIDLSQLPKNIQISIPKPCPGTYDDFDLVLNYHAVLNHNSGVGILAAMAGSRPVVHHSSLAYPVSINIQDIERAYLTDRSAWLIQIAHTEYTVEEILQGIWLKRLDNWLQ